ncbi:MAG: lipoyl(octanoyl) transferase LipB [Gemmatimonadota bacterium]
MMPPLAVAELGPVPYHKAHALQRALADRRISGELDRDVLLLLEHERTITLGRGTRASSLPLSPEALAERGLTVAEVERGGDVTWHGPGQLVGYPILDLHGHRLDLHWYLRQVEEALIVALAQMGLPAERNPGQTGVWTSGRKIASIGVHVRHWVTSHGFALNVSNDLRDFDLIVPCGISGVEMTSVARERALQEEIDAERASSLPAEATDLWRETIAAVSHGMGCVFGRTPVSVALATLLPQGTARPEPAY